MRTIAVTLGAVLLALLIAAGVYVRGVIRRAPEITALDAVPKGYRSAVTDVSGEVVLTLSKDGSNRVYVKLSEIPENLQHAFVAIEDERFYRHRGVDIRGIFRALWNGIRTREFSQGASTITQQLLKNNVFTEWTEEVTFRDRLERKIQEQYLAIELEKSSSKDWILENYLNTINLGGGNYGVETAARYYFGKDVSALTLSECASLAAITKSPTQYNPLLNPEANDERRLLVLDKMLALGYINEEERESAAMDPVCERIAKGESAGGIPTMNYFEDALIEALIKDLTGQLAITEDEAWEMLYTGGLTIRSTEDSSLQAICERVAEDDALYGEDAQISMVLIDNASGQVRAMIGGRGEKEGSLLLNRATQVMQQPGSVIKIIGEYAAALEAGEITLGTVFDDAPYAYSNGTPVGNASGTFGGRTTVRSAISASNNVIALKCFQQTGMRAVLHQLRLFGISTLTEYDEVEALALGATYGGVTNLEVTAAFSSLARDGEYREPVFYTEVLDREGNVIVEKNQAASRAVSRDTAALLTSAMEDVLADGTGTRAAFDGMCLAGKSGTTTGAADLWFVGYSPYLSLGVWGGRDNHGEQENTGYVQDVWRTVMEEAHKDLEEVSFAMPDNFVEVEICEKCGKLAVSGLCDKSDQGDMTRTEIFRAGTEPRETCDCHVKVTLCRESGQIAGRYCRTVETHIYLREGTEGTADEAFVTPSGSEAHECTLHSHYFSNWFHKNEDSGSASGGTGSPGGASGSQGESGREEEEEESAHWWQKLFNWW